MTTVSPGLIVRTGFCALSYQPNCVGYWRTSARPGRQLGERQFERGTNESPALMAQTKIANLALQGGGTHGAFTWGVLERLLEEPGFEIDGVSATSAGAMNAVVLAHGLTVAGRAGAGHALADFWQRVASIAKSSFLQPSWYDRMTHNHRLGHPPRYFFFYLPSALFLPL